MMSLPREWSSLLWLLQSRVTRKIFGGPAPFEGDCGNVPGIDPEVVVVSLASGHSVAQHGRTIHRASDLEQAMIHVDHFHDPLFGDITTYKAKTSDASLIAAIRSDYGVQFVTCDEPPLLPAVIRDPRPGYSNSSQQRMLCRPSFARTHAILDQDNYRVHDQQSPEPAVCLR
ncbi:hypothetical protein AMS68_002272 [Peltaster fructicola]|uniref:Uncharacterized protein n=1 Tax=Peltaster fructicola TaxID=286661 RepID=A0A6H0XQ43_9PEZI|nr:hypothetical protein AMS68_002272 [Peltaster fructicola]